MPHRSTLSRFLAALDQAPVEALRTLFREDVLARPLEKSEKPGGLWDREGNHWMVFDVDGTRQAARQRALPCTPDRPPAQRRLSEVCAPGYTGRKRGEVVRTRTTILQAHTHQWVGTFSGAGNGDYRGELRQAVKRRLRKRASWKDDCHLRGREAMQAQNSAYGLLEPPPRSQVISKVTAQIPFDLRGHFVLDYESIFPGDRARPTSE